jgi:hypothetical protein
VDAPRDDLDVGQPDAHLTIGVRDGRGLHRIKVRVVGW